MFQSLVGKLETPDPLLLPSVLSLFQSLVGKLETDVSLTDAEQIILFQSLVGKLETIRLRIGQPNDTRVSIPCR